MSEFNFSDIAAEIPSEVLAGIIHFGIMDRHSTGESLGDWEWNWSERDGLWLIANNYVLYHFWVKYEGEWYGGFVDPYPFEDEEPWFDLTGITAGAMRILDFEYDYIESETHVGVFNALLNYFDMMADLAGQDENDEDERFYDDLIEVTQVVIPLLPDYAETR